MLLQLRYVYDALYKGRYKHGPYLKTKWTTIRFAHSAGEEAEKDRNEKLFEYFAHPSTYRWLAPALKGNLVINASGEEMEGMIANRQQIAFPVKNHVDFLRLHFEPVYDRIKVYCDPAITGSAKENVRDLMGRASRPRKATGSAIRKELRDQFADPQMIRKMVIAQQRILEQYEYRACDFRSGIMGVVDRAMCSSKEETEDKSGAAGSSQSRDREVTENTTDTSLMKNGVLPLLRTVLLKLLSKGSDAAALACLLLCAALREDAALILIRFMGADQDILSLSEEAKPGSVELGDGMYLTYSERSNYKGGLRKSDITLWAEPETMIEKITDIFGYFFYPAEINDVEGFRTGYRKMGPQVEYMCRVYPFENEHALFQWVYQPDGRYFEDDWGFGGEDCEEIVLYALMDKKGRFVTPFSVNKPIPGESEG